MLLFTIALLSLVVVSVSYSQLSNGHQGGAGFTSTEITTITIRTLTTTTTTTTTSVRIGCQGIDGSIYISPNTNATTYLKICGAGYIIHGGPGGGLVFEYAAGNLTLVAPATVGGRPFQFWYVILSNGSSIRVSNTLLTLRLPPGLTSTNSIIQVFYQANPGNNQSTTTATTTIASSIA
jgi:hypothetical protein